MSYDNKVRIIGGKFKGKRLAVLDKEGLRPTTDRVRETLFNWLDERMSGAKVLDLFAGSGALGLEALSRGAQAVTLVEKDGINARQLKSEIASLPQGLAKQVEVIEGDALNFLRNLSPATQYSLIFLDPPFASNLLEQSVELIAERDLLADNGLVYVEMSSAKKKPLLGLSLIRDEVIGQCHFGLYERSFFA